MEPNNFTLSELVSFGNYLLSKERDSMTSDLSKECVTDADIANWTEKEGIEDIEPSRTYNSGSLVSGESY